ncbi:MAG: TonB-linked SusC/RagA family outer membrane protein [Paraglaciecola sp.]|jgi:TonB-linked SusC/RagA family outer membrane protein
MKLKFNIFLRCLSMLLLIGGLSSTALAQRTISGTITDAESGDPLIGANVLVVGSSVGTVTDIDGKYSLNAPADAKQVEISYTGYSTRTVDMGASNVMDFKLSSGELLDEIVVIGYGTQKRSDVTGAISTISAKDFNAGIITNPDQLIQGKVAGVQVTNNSGAPGGASTVRIRGVSSIRSGSEPLYVVDGVPLDGRTATPGLNGTDLGNFPGVNPLTFLNTSDIASIDILKDASAAAIYGSRGANGVILITTKKGIPGKTVVEVQMGAGISNIANTYDVLDGDGYRSALNRYNGAAATPADRPFIVRDEEGNPVLANGNEQLLGDEGQSVDAQDEIMQTGITQNYSIAFSGGNEDGNYRLSAGYQDQEGIVKKTGLKKYVASLRGNYKLLDSKRLNLDYNVTVSHVKLQSAPISTDAGFTGNLVGQALQWNPTSPLYDADSDTGFNILKGSSTINPVAMSAAYEDESNTTNVFAWIAPSFEIVDGLTYKFNYSIFHGIGDRNVSINRFINLQNVEDRGFAAVGTQKLTTQYLAHTLNYETKLAGNNLSLLGGFEYINFSNKGTGITGRDFENNGIAYTDQLQGSSDANRLVSSFNEIESELQSFFGRVNYDIQGKYLFTATVRADGSSKFGENNKYGIFPSFAAAWNITNEDFAPAIFDRLKLRAGWGITGNQEFPAGASQRQFTVQNGGGTTETTAANPDLQWEESTTFNVGIDFAIANYRLVGSVEYFNRTTSDLLFSGALAAPAPNISIFRNLPGEIVNSGVELALSAILVDKGNLTWDLGANVAFIKNELRNFPQIEEVGGLFGQGISGTTAQRFVDGQPLYSWYTRDFIEIGDDGQSIYAENEARKYLGDPLPDMLLGVFTNVKYQGFSLNLAFNGSFGQTIYNNTANTVIGIGNLGTRNIDAALLDGDVLEAPSNAIKASDRYIESADYIRLNNATLAYQFGDVWGLKGLQVSITGQNLLVITDYSGFDPEINTVNTNANGVPSFGIEYTPYPTARTFLVGVGFKF